MEYLSKPNPNGAKRSEANRQIKNAYKAGVATM